MRARSSNTLSFGLRPQPIADSRAIPWLALPRIHPSQILSRNPEKIFV
jgi:hypothetical protein